LNPESAQRCDCGTELHGETVKAEPSGFSSPDAQSAGDAQSLAGPSAPAPSDVSPEPPYAQPEPPYAQLSIRMLGSFLFLCAAVFDSASAIFRGGSAITFLTLIPLAAGGLLAWSAWQAWTLVRVAEPDTEVKFRLRHRNVVVTALMILLICGFMSAVAGSAVGQRRSKAELVARINADLDQYKATAHRIGRARNGVAPHIESYVEMYGDVEPDVLEYETVLHRLTAELNAYDSRAPEQHDRTLQNLALTETELRRADLLKQQIAVAKRLESTDPGDRFAIWKAQMVPLLHSETELDRRSNSK
jgi:hypothetical protein